MTTDRFCVGALRPAFDSGFNGNMKEILILPAMSDFERQKVEGYLAHKGGL